MSSWTGPLTDLLPELRRRAFALAGAHDTPALEQAARLADRDWAWVVLGRGALVAYRIRGDMHMRGELRLARKEPLTNAAAWARECAVFLEKFGIVELDGRTPSRGQARTDYFRQDGRAEDEGRTVARWIEARYGEVRVGVALCRVCGQETEWHAPFGPDGQACPEHVRDAT